MPELSSPASEHDALLAHGWTVTEGKAGRGAGYSANPTNGRRERLWLSPACIGGEQSSIFSILNSDSNG